MSGKYIQFRNPDGHTLKGKGKFCRETGINSYRLDNLREGRANGTFILKGVEWTFKTIYANPEPRTYIPNPDGIITHKAHKPTYSKIYGSLELVYSTATNRLVMTRALNHSQSQTIAL